VDKRSWKAIEVAERFVDGRATEEEKEVVWRAACAAASKAARGSDDAVHAATATVADHLVAGPFYKDHAAQRCSTLFDDLARDSELWSAALENGKMQQVTLLRDIFGNPFRPVILAPAYCTPTVVSLARTAYDERQMPSGEMDPVRLTVLADALEEVGAPGEVVVHLRSPGPHVRGCHVVDICLGLN
jgi:hypothetical protein